LIVADIGLIWINDDTFPPLQRMNTAALWYTACHIVGDHKHQDYQLVGQL